MTTTTPAQESQPFDTNPNLSVSPQPTKDKDSIVSLLFSIMMFLIGILGLGYGFYNYQRAIHLETELQKLKQKPRTVILLPTKSISQASEEAKISITTTLIPVQIPLGYIAKNTLCYTIYIPRNNTSGEENNCELSYEASIEEGGHLGADIQVEYTNFSSLKEMVETRTGSFTNKFYSEGIVKVGNLDGEKIIESLPDGNKLTHVFIYLPDKYRVNSYMATGFEITKTIILEEEQAQIDNLNVLLTTWKWK